MSTESTARRAAPLACTRCRDTAGPFTKDGLCEDCTPAGELRSAPEDGEEHGTPNQEQGQ
ncbi:hypothetical protein [Streptomyces sp. NPDC101249]|uniref:hypothetical protein n=1 Tax=Streptomyces sp. NPDC101249 TaxID=3366140 RepID=UPI00382AF9E8